MEIVTVGENKTLVVFLTDGLKDVIFNVEHGRIVICKMELLHLGIGMQMVMVPLLLETKPWNGLIKFMLTVHL